MIIDEAQNTAGSDENGAHAPWPGFADGHHRRSQPDRSSRRPAIGLADAVNRLKSVDGVGIIPLSGKDVVRHPVVARILQAYESDGQSAQATGQTRKNRSK